MADWGVPTTLTLLLASLVAWNLATGARSSTLASAGRNVRVLSGLCAFLLLPALVIGLLAPTAPGARVLAPLAWLWPLVSAAVAAQATWSLVSGRARVALALPIMLFDVAVFWIALARWLSGAGVLLPDWLLAPGLAVSSLGAAALGDGAFVWAAGALVPALVPIAPARSRLGSLWRAVVATGCALALVTLGTEVPSALRQLAAGHTPYAESMPDRSRSEFAIGLRLFGTLAGAPSAASVRHDVPLADSLGITAVHVELDADGLSNSALDSLARTLEGRRDSVLLIVTLDLAPGDDATARRRASWIDTRLGVIQRIVQRLRPDVLIPADGVPAATSATEIAAWQAYYERVARSARRVDRDITIALATEADSDADSTLCDWVMRGESPMNAVALSVHSARGTPGRFGSALAAVARWVSLARTVPSVFVLGVPTSPAVTGERAQQQAVRRALQWSTSRSWVRAVIAGDASDEFAATGLRTTTGRSRRALAEVGVALRTLRDLPVAAPIVPDSAATGPVRTAPDSLATIRP